MIALVEPPSASSTRSAFSTDFAVTILSGVTAEPIRLTAAHAGRLGGAQAVGMHRRDRGGARQDHAERLGDAGHGAGRAHHRAGAGGRPRAGPRPRAISSALDLAGAVAAPRSGGSRCRRRAARPGGGRSSSARRPAAPPARPAETAPISCAGTVLSQPPISTTASIGCARIISSVSIAIRLRNFRLVGLRNTSPSEIGREIDRQAARRQHAALHRLEQLREMPVAVVEAGAGVGDADHRPLQHFARIAHRTREGAAQIQRKIRSP